MSYTQGKIILQLNGLLHLEHKDVSKEKHSIEQISGSISFDTATKINTIELKSLNNKAFNEMSGFNCILVLLDKLLFGSGDKSKSKNIIDFSPSGFSCEEYISFGENGYAQKNIEVTKIGDNVFKADIETWHRYDFALSSKVDKILFSTETIVKNNDDQLIGKGFAYLQTKDMELFKASCSSEIFLKENASEINDVQIFSFEYENIDTSTPNVDTKVKGNIDIIP